VPRRRVFDAEPKRLLHQTPSKLMMNDE
jgi:hypothetical protein